MAVIAAVYMRIFLPDSMADDALSVPILSKEKLDVVKSKSDGDSAPKTLQIFKPMTSFEDMLTLLKTRSVNLVTLLSVEFEI